jgi:hypothetical protein
LHVQLRPRRLELQSQHVGRPPRSVCSRHRDTRWAVAANPQAKHMGNQILRSGTAAAPNYWEARAAENTELCKILVTSMQTARRTDSLKPMGKKGKKAADEN